MLENRNRLKTYSTPKNNYKGLSHRKVISVLKKRTGSTQMDFDSNNNQIDFTSTNSPSQFSDFQMQIDQPMTKSEIFDKQHQNLQKSNNQRYKNTSFEKNYDPSSIINGNVYSSEYMIEMQKKHQRKVSFQLSPLHKKTTKQNDFLIRQLALVEQSKKKSDILEKKCNQIKQNCANFKISTKVYRKQSANTINSPDIQKINNITINNSLNNKNRGYSFNSTNTNIRQYSKKVNQSSTLYKREKQQPIQPNNFMKDTNNDLQDQQQFDNVLVNNKENNNENNINKNNNNKNEEEEENQVQKVRIRRKNGFMLGDQQTSKNNNNSSQVSTRSNSINSPVIYQYGNKLFKQHLSNNFKQKREQKMKSINLNYINTFERYTQFLDENQENKNLEDMPLKSINIYE